MGRRRLPTAILEARGSFLHDPQRRRARANEPKPSGPLGDPPTHLKADQKALWHELAGLLPRGVAGNSDRIVMELLCVLMAKFRRGKAIPGEQKQIESLLGRFGMTAADRSRVTARLADAMNRAEIA